MSPDVLLALAGACSLVAVAIGLALLFWSVRKVEREVGA